MCIRDRRKIVEEGTVDYTKGLAPKVFEFGARWTELIRDYPLIQKYVFLYNPDLQGPLDVYKRQAMMEWPKIYTKRWEENGIYHFRCSDTPQDLSLIHI